jgi:hypothetical protein
MVTTNAEGLEDWDCRARHEVPITPDGPIAVLPCGLPRGHHTPHRTTFSSPGGGAAFEWPRAIAVNRSAFVS